MVHKRLCDLILVKQLHAANEGSSAVVQKRPAQEDACTPRRHVFALTEGEAAATAYGNHSGFCERTAPPADVTCTRSSS